MRQALEIIGAAVVAFVATTAYVRYIHPPEPSSVAPTAPVIRETNQPESQGALSSELHAPTSLRSATRSPTHQLVSHVRNDSSTSQSVVDDGPKTAEHVELEEFFGGVSHISPLDARQKAALLESKLRHRRSYDAMLIDAGATRDSLSPAERAYAHTTAARALKQYQSDFLDEAKSLLNEQQYTALADFEATEFRRRLAELQTSINSK